MLPARLRAALRKLNPSLPDEALQQAEIALTADRSAMLPVAANREVYRLLRDGMPVQVRQPDGSLKDERVAVIDWTNPAANDFFLGSQVWIESNLYKRRPDAVGFVNGIPLLLIEWKDLTQPVQEAYEANLRDYRDTIPRLFDFNGFTILSNGLEALMGPSHAPFESFAPWKRLEEDGPESVALETMLRATCEPTRFLDLVENFLLFEERGRPAQGRRQVPSGPRRQPRHRGSGADRREPGAGSASSGTRRAAARASRWSSSPRRCCGGSAATGPSSSSPTGRSWTTRLPGPSLPSGR